MSLIFVDCEAWGGCPALGQLTEFGAVNFDTNETFHGVLVEAKPDPARPAVPLSGGKPTLEHERRVFEDFARWLRRSQGPPLFVSDNPAFDWQWINDGFLRTLGRNPFGHSARRIGDFYAGLTGDFRNASRWKRLRVTKHDHNPVHDALGNVEAFRRMLRGER